MKAFLWRIVYAAFFVVVFRIVFPLFMAVVGFPASGPLENLILICVACIAVAYVLFGPPPPTPF